jgi:hypothetical protein
MIDPALRLLHVEGVTYNFIVDDGSISSSRCPCTLFCGGSHGSGDPIVRVPSTATMIDLLVSSGFFPSKGQARKNWRGEVEIPPGYSEHEIGQGRRRKVFFVWRPIPWPTAQELVERFRERSVKPVNGASEG